VSELKMAREKQSTAKSQTSLIWPKSVALPPENITLVYLDMNHWIGLSKAAADHPSGEQFRSVLEVCRAARRISQAAFILSGTIYGEMLKIKDPAQRMDLASVMEELTDFASLASRTAIMERELDAAIDPFAKAPSRLPMTALVGRGALHAFGLHGVSNLTELFKDEDFWIRAKAGTQNFDQLIAEIGLKFERSVLAGPSNEAEVQQLGEFGWGIKNVIRVAEERSQEENSQARRLDAEPSWRKGNLRDVVSAHELITEFQNILPRRLSERGIVLSDVANEPESGRALVGAMASAEVSIALKTAWHRNSEKRWSANDIYDIDAMALAVPYCDVVLTDKACFDALEKADLGNRMHTALLRSLEDLPAVLENWKPTRWPQRA
jgi:hypothetical protein